MAANALDEARKVIGLSVDDLWMRYFALGGNLVPSEVSGYLHGLFTIDVREHNFLALALNEAFSDLGMCHPLGYQGLPKP